MPYDNNFYEQYRQYLEEPAVRTAHNKMFNIFGAISNQIQDVMDLGSGLGEYYNYYQKYTIGNYCSLDFENPNDLPNFVKGSYVELNFELPFNPTAFVSLFSTECCYPMDFKEIFYERIFKKIPTIRYGMVSGFYYESSRDKLIIQETGDIASFQAIDNQRDWISSSFQEFRTYLRVPSQMFGDDVVEVWKIFIRLSSNDQHNFSPLLY